MVDGGQAAEQAPFGELFGRLIDEGKGFARAELGLVRAQAEAKVDVVKLPVLLFGAAFLFLVASVIVLCMTIALALASLIGPLAGGLAATVIALATAAGLALLGKRKLDSGK